MTVGFDGVLEPAGNGGSRVEIPADALAALGGGSRFRVRGSLDDVAFESSTMPLGGGRVCLGVHKATRASAGVAFGQRVRVEVERDDRPREVTVPPALREALAADAACEQAFGRLAFTHRREYAQWVAEAKREETRRRRVATTMAMLREGMPPA